MCFVVKDVMRLLREKQPEIDLLIEKWVPRRFDEKSIERTLGRPAYSYDVETARKAINDLAWDLMDRGGKRWRPVLLQLTAEAVGGEEAKEKAREFMVLPEVVHNGTLAIDDVEDSSQMRRGKPCLNITYGVDLAVNAGNAMYFIPLKVLMNDATLSAEEKNRIYAVYAQEMINVSYGQGFDIYWHKGLAKKVTEGQYLQMCAYKTGCLARMSAKIGAVIGGGGEAVVEAAGRFAEALGIAFQIQDDLLNLLGDEKEYGKEIGGDVTEGKRTLMVIYAVDCLSKKEGGRLVEILDKHTSDQRLILEAVGLMKKAGSLDYADRRGKEIVGKAWKDFEKMLESSGAKEYLESFAHFAMNRKV